MAIHDEIGPVPTTAKSSLKEECQNDSHLDVRDLDAMKTPTRREFLRKAGIAGLFVSLMKLDLSAALAATQETIPDLEDEQFLAVSRALTGCNDLDPTLSSRLKHALATILPDVVHQVCEMAASLTSDTTSDLLMTNAGAAHDALLALNAAWYMGSVQDRTNAPMVAYADALMYRPVKDALPVPTYCFAEPGWWSQTPPLDLNISPVVDKTPPPPPPAGVLGSSPRQSGIITPAHQSPPPALSRQPKDTH